MNQENNTNQTVLSDEEIINLYWQRQEQAIKETDLKYGRYLFTVAYNIVHDRLDCEECLNDTYLGTWNAIPPNRPNIFQVFLARIMRNSAVDKYRERTASRRIPSELTDSLSELEEAISYSENISEDVFVKDAIKVLNTYLMELDDKDRFVFVCRYYYADSVPQIAKMTQLSERSVFRILATTREKLKKKLEEAGFKYE
jgi:RNA polymerase sigma-70 factor (ECF subfamily)